jgi:hypothetical protein
MELLDEQVERLEGRQGLVWGVAIGSYGFGDFLTTTVGLTSGRGAEAGPLASGLVAEYGLAGLLGLKIATLLGFYGLWRVARTPGRVAVPLALAVVGVGVTLWNLLVLVT